MGGAEESSGRASEGDLEKTGQPGTEGGQLLGKAAHTHDGHRDSESQIRIKTGQSIRSCCGQEVGEGIAAGDRGSLSQTHLGPPCDAVSFCSFVSSSSRPLARSPEQCKRVSALRGDISDQGSVAPTPSTLSGGRVAAKASQSGQTEVQRSHRRRIPAKLTKHDTPSEARARGTAARARGVCTQQILTFRWFRL